MDDEISVQVKADNRGQAGVVKGREEKGKSCTTGIRVAEMRFSILSFVLSSQECRSFFSFLSLMQHPLICSLYSTFGKPEP
jgi:hypothetical protein